MFETMMSEGAKDKFADRNATWKDDVETTSSWSSEHGNDMRRNAWTDTKSQRHAWMTINSKKKKVDHSENCLQNCLQFVHRLF